ncbi:protein SIEVE ELEMENT OCCLUSION B-like [Corylus avellana]|uniref:protein SIEVE ELEMENT OCCLUSION B-like n=1 Tax=Corylus avellana TaxID=13451 RepID=UPI00286BB01B|nr:protein SIEVE ELEMENT OCCLUSION B-like [Corylus avellana]
MSFCYNSLMRLISAVHAHVRADEKNDADSLFVDVKNDLKHTTRTVDNALLGQEHPENLVSIDSFDPLLFRLGLEQLSYEYFLAPAQFHSSRQDVESVEIPKHVPTTLKHLHLQKYKEKISEVNKMINDVLDFSESVIELKKLSTANYIKDEQRSDIVGLISSGVYWIIITVVACTTQICCLTSEK